jgi:HD superfamily phosphodiesterase
VQLAYGVRFSYNGLNMRKLIQQYAKDLTAGRLASGYEHSYRLYRLARQIGESLDYYDDEILHAACFLHDLDITARHPEASAEKARAILEETGFTPGKIQAVYVAILNHMPGEEGDDQAVETKLLHDANLLDTLGAIGFARLAIGSFFWFHYKTMEEVLDLLRQWRGYVDRFYFPTSREMAGPKVEFLDRALEQLSNELCL